MPKAPKVKVSAKLPGGKVLHPNSRKAAALSKKEHHNERMIRRKQESNLKMGSRGERLLWFRDNLESEKINYNKEDVLNFVERYLRRFDDELSKIKEANSMPGRKGRQFAAREDTIKLQLVKDARDFDTSGLEIPDLFDENNVKYLRDWNGELRFVTNVKMKSVTLSDLLEII